MSDVGLLYGNSVVDTLHHLHSLKYLLQMLVIHSDGVSACGSSHGRPVIANVSSLEPSSFCRDNRRPSGPWPPTACHPAAVKSLDDLRSWPVSIRSSSFCELRVVRRRPSAMRRRCYLARSNGAGSPASVDCRLDRQHGTWPASGQQQIGQRTLSSQLKVIKRH